MLPPVYDHADIGAHRVVGYGLDRAPGTEIYPTRSLNFHGGFGKLLLEIFPGLE